MCVYVYTHPHTYMLCQLRRSKSNDSSVAKITLSTLMLVYICKFFTRRKQGSLKNLLIPVLREEDKRESKEVPKSVDTSMFKLQRSQMKKLLVARAEKALAKK